MMSLREIQQWMQAAITHPEGVRVGADSPAARTALATTELVSEIESLILPSRQLTSEQGMEVYANAYYARLLECLRDEFPALVALLGDEIFNAFAFEYLQSYPSSSYTLADLGSRFHRFFSENRSRAFDHSGGEVTFKESGEADHASSVSWIDLVLDLTALERTYSEVFSGPGIENCDTLSAEGLASLEPDSIGSLCLTPAPCVRLLRLETRAHEYAIAVRKSPSILPDVPAFDETFIVVTRRNYVVRTIVVERAEFLLLKQLFDGSTLEQAIARVCDEYAVGEVYLEQQIANWFKKWAIDRLFVSFTTESQTT